MKLYKKELEKMLKEVFKPRKEREIVIFMNDKKEVTGYEWRDKK